MGWWRRRGECVSARGRSNARATSASGGVARARRARVPDGSRRVWHVRHPLTILRQSPPPRPITHYPLSIIDDGSRRGNHPVVVPEGRHPFSSRHQHSSPIIIPLSPRHVITVSSFSIHHPSPPIHHSSQAQRLAGILAARDWELLYSCVLVLQALPNVVGANPNLVGNQF